jgi:hypothetical protein
MELLTKCVAVLIGGLIIWALWRANQGRSVFVVRITYGEPRAVVGTVTPAFLQRIREVAVDHKVRTGQVSGLARGPRIRLEFSRQIPEGGRHQLRNWWAASGWNASRVRA